MRAISIIGAGSCTKEQYETAVQVGKYVAEAGFDLVCGGMSGVMEAACKGATQAGGTTIGILPGSDKSQANEYVTVPIATGLGQMRNHMVVINAEGCIAVFGGAGTLSEIGHALKAGKEVVALGSWAELPGVHKTDSPEQAVETLLGLLDHKD